MRIGVLWDKVWHDLWENKGRTLQVVLIIAVGAFAIGMIIGTRNFMIAGMEASWRAASPAMIQLWAAPGLNDDQLLALKNVPGVTAVEGFAQGAVEWRLADTDHWQPASLIARADYREQTFTKLTLMRGLWPQKKAFAVVQGADVQYGIKLNSQVQIRLDTREFTVPVTGIIYDPNAQPPSFGGRVQFYTTRDRFNDLLDSRDFNRILAGTARWDEPTVTAIADAIQAKLEKQSIESGGFAPNGSRIANPNKHFFQDSLDGIFFILGLMASLALLLGMFLVYNTISAIIRRQVNQIGILKAIGASTGQILTVYLLIVFAYGVLALLLALPLGIVGAQGLGGYLMSAFNGEGRFELSPIALLAQVAIALLAPLVACLTPVLAGARTTVREAISSYGLSAKASWLDRMLARLQRLPQLLSLTISNTFRHQSRMVLTQITLVLSGLIFMTVMSVRDAAVYTFDDLLFSILRFNINFQFEQPERIGYVEQLTLAQPGVKAVEMWGIDNATVRRAGQPESNDDRSAVLFGVPLPTTLYNPQLRAGRWLQPTDTYAIVLNQKLATDVGVTVGDSITLKHGTRGESTWRIVGLLYDPIITSSIHMPREPLLRELGIANRANTIWIQLDRTDAESEQAMARQLRDFYRYNKLRPYAISVFGQDTASQIVANILGQFAIIITLLATMAVVIGIVGSIALSGVLSLNVLERRREIGVLRAVGASSGAIGRLFVGEGLILGWLSWLIALPLSIPTGRLMIRGLSAALNGEVIYRYTPTGALIWLAIITLLSIAASGLPARAAIRVSVRESLAYE